MKNMFSQLLTRKTLILVGVYLLGILVVVILFDQFIMPWYTKHGEALAVPNVVAQRFEDAKDILELQGLNALKAGEKYSSTLPFGYVVEQNPRPDRLVKKGRNVYLTISAGEREIQVPNLKGLSETNAYERLKSSGLSLGDVEYEYSQNELPDVVMKQSEEPGVLVKANSPIDITVSLGEPTENVKVPSVLGKTLQVAKRDIRRAGLIVGEITYKTNNEYLQNTVLDQSPAPGNIVANGDTVSLLVTTFDSNH
ncbi:MAG: PASTA domain-containing protein [bacterium]